MARGVEGLADDLTSPRLTTGEGPGAYDALLDTLRRLRDDPALREPLAAAWRDRTFDSPVARPLLLLAAWRYLALADDAHPLSPEALMDALAPDVEARVREALADPGLIDVLRARRIVSHDPGAALGWGLVATALRLPQRSFALADLGCAAGLALLVDLTAFPLRIGLQQVMGLDFPSPRRRLGLDRAPIDALDTDEVRWLRSCVWPGQPPRTARLEACLSVRHGPWPAALPAPRIATHDLGREDTAARLVELEADPEVRAVIAAQSVVEGELDAAARATHREALEGWLREGRRRVWTRLEPAPPGPGGAEPVALTASLARRGTIETIELGRCGYHPDGARLAPGAIAQLRALWATP